METDSFFCQLLKQLPQTLFELLGMPAERARAYRFDSVEVKKSLRIDGVMLPAESSLPVMVVEVQFQLLATFYANLFGKVFWYLEENDPAQEWIAVAIFESRNLEPKELGPYEDMLRSPRVKRIYLDEYPMPPDPPLGLSVLQLLSASPDQAKPLVARLVHKAEVENADSELRTKVIDLVEELLLRRFTQFDREEVRKMFQLHDLRKSKVWREAHEEGREEGREEGKTLAETALVRKCVAKGMSIKEIATLMEIPVAQVRRLAKKSSG